MLDLEVAPAELKTMLAGQDQPFLLDVREPWETSAAGFPGALSMPMGDVPSRSLNVANWLRTQGFEQAQSLRGGIDAWSRDVDPAVTRY
jgi:rhodanese-related sulfurtransferase